MQVLVAAAAYYENMYIEAQKFLRETAARIAGIQTFILVLLTVEVKYLII